MMMEMVFMTSMRFITQKIQKIGMISLLVIMMEMVFQMHLKHQEIPALVIGILTMTALRMVGKLRIFKMIMQG